MLALTCIHTILGFEVCCGLMCLLLSSRQWPSSCNGKSHQAACSSTMCAGAGCGILSWVCCDMTIHMLTMPCVVRLHLFGGWQVGRGPLHGMLSYFGSADRLVYYTCIAIWHVRALRGILYYLWLCLCVVVAVAMVLALASPGCIPPRVSLWFRCHRVVHTAQQRHERLRLPSSACVSHPVCAQRLILLPASCL